MCSTCVQGLSTSCQVGVASCQVDVCHSSSLSKVDVAACRLHDCHPCVALVCRLFTDSSSSAADADAEVAVLVADLLSVDRNHTRSLLPKLHKLYCAAPDLEQIPPLKLIRHPKVLKLLTLGCLAKTLLVVTSHELKH